ncbi:MAG: bifunctional lysylphosphatidylglycerol flippase/synthetase MprF [Gemmatimonadaceae bacterium]|nr:bifunctional lysylphosphatidylglycerol flippase/synthetase MprF [Gemmatimonadaceae bacterium]
MMDSDTGSLATLAPSRRARRASRQAIDLGSDARALEAGLSEDAGFGVADAPITVPLVRSVPVLPERARRALGIALPIVAFAAALWALYHVSNGTDYHAILRGVAAVPATRLAVAGLLAAASYGILALLDGLALRHIRVSLGVRRTAFASFAAAALGHALGFPLLTGGAVRYRLYTAWGVGARQIATAVAFGGVTFWIGLVAATAALLLAGSAPSAAAFRTTQTIAVLVGLTCAVIVAGYLALVAARPAGFRVRSLRVRPPHPAIALGQVVLPVIDWAIAGAILYTLLPADSVPLPTVLGVFLVAQILGLLSHVPAGLGVVDTAVVGLLAPWLPAEPVLVALVAYRAIYYVVPLVITCLLLAARELLPHRDAIRSAARTAGGYAPTLLPVVLTAAVFIAGAVLIVSSATPPVRARMRLLHQVSPTSVIESAYFFASLVGTALMLVSRGLYRRLDGAWVLAIVLLVAGAVASVLKGLDYEEATFLVIVLTALAAARGAFPRRSTLTTLEFGPSWVVATAVVLAASVWLVFISYRHMLFTSNGWWHFLSSPGSSRALWPTLGAVVLAGIAAVARLLRPVQPPTARPGADQIALAANIIEHAPAASAHLALLGDKALLFNEARTAFLMYAVVGRSWVAMGAPVGPPADCVELAWRFRELADQHGGRAVFYLVPPGDLPLYLDLGLTLLKLGESARVPLATLTLDGGGRKWLRRARKKALEEGCSFEVVDAEAAARLVPELRRVSDAWLAAKQTREKGFSLGYFDEPYLRRLPVAVVRRAGTVVAFANLWPGGGREELSVDLMRYSEDAPEGVTDFLFCELMLWGKAAGYRWFDLGMAPLSGLEARRFAPLWTRLGGLLYRRGEAFYSFKGLRRFKEKFDPVWEPRYIATPGGMALPSVLGDVTALISGGLAGALRK